MAKSKSMVGNLGRFHDNPKSNGLDCWEFVQIEAEGRKYRSLIHEVKFGPKLYQHIWLFKGMEDDSQTSLIYNLYNSAQNTPMTKSES